jgi:sugar O-acyltransferase (sialic acid O-acetyltransferase NeuD family)
MSKEAIIIGYSGHAFVMLDVISANGISCRLYCERERKDFNPYQLEYLGRESQPEVLEYLQDHDVYICIGDNNVRSKVFKYLSENYISMPTIYHPSAIISSTARISTASVVMPGTIINALCNIGKGVICNTGSILEHETKIGDFSHIAPGAVLAGNVSVGPYSFIGANAVIKQGVTIGSGVVVGAGSVIIEDIADANTVYGNPGKIKR